MTNTVSANNAPVTEIKERPQITTTVITICKKWDSDHLFVLQRKIYGYLNKRLRGEK